MTDKINLPSDEIMHQMAKMAIEQSTTYFANQAEQFAEAIRTSGKSVDGATALDAFARAIRNTNHKIYPPKGPSQ